MNVEVEHSRVAVVSLLGQPSYEVTPAKFSCFAAVRKINKQHSGIKVL